MYMTITGQRIQSSSSSENKKRDIACNSHAWSQLRCSNNCVLLQTAVAWMEGSLKAEYWWLLLDSGSQRIFIVTGLSRSLGCVHIRKERMTIGAFIGTENEQWLYVVEVKTAESPKGNLLKTVELDVILSPDLPRPDEKAKSYRKEMGLILTDEQC